MREALGKLNVQWSPQLGADWASPDLGDWPVLVAGVASAVVATAAILVSARTARLGAELQRGIAADARVWDERKQAYIDVIDWTRRVAMQVTFPGPLEGRDEDPRRDLTQRMELFGTDNAMKKFKMTVELYKLWRKEGGSPGTAFLAATDDEITALTEWNWKVLEATKLKPSIVSLKGAIRAEFADIDIAEADAYDVIAELETDEDGTPTGVRIASWMDMLD